MEVIFEPICFAALLIVVYSYGQFTEREKHSAQVKQIYDKVVSMIAQVKKIIKD